MTTINVATASTNINRASHQVNEKQVTTESNRPFQSKIMSVSPSQLNFTAMPKGPLSVSLNKQGSQFMEVMSYQITTRPGNINHVTKPDIKNVTSPNNMSYNALNKNGNAFEGIARQRITTRPGVIKQGLISETKNEPTIKNSIYNPL